VKTITDDQKKTAREKLIKVVSSVVPELTRVEANPQFGYGVFLLSNAGHARIYRVQRGLSKAHNEIAPPQEGRYVAATVTLLKKNDLVLAYGEYPKDGGESVHLGMLKYDDHEYDKIPDHIVDFLVTGKVPIADDNALPLTL